MSAGHAVRVMRRAQGLTLRQLAKRSGTSHSYLSQVERGEKVARPDRLRAVLDALADNLIHRARLTQPLQNRLRS